MLVNPNDVEEISFAIKKVISDSAFRNSLINLGSQNVKKYSAESVAEEYFNLYKKISI
jgi:glycosyltransferase involved in cell wall biosynthesis